MARIVRGTNEAKVFSDVWNERSTSRDSTLYATIKEQNLLNVFI